MDRRGGCCIAKYPGAGGGGPYNASKMDLIMQRFRPIAPKLSPSGDSSSPVEYSGCMKSRRGRRGCSSSSSCGRKKKSISPEQEKACPSSWVQNRPVVTLPLLPETPDLMRPATRLGQQPLLPVPETKEGVPPRGEKLVVWSSVTVERVTATWGEEGGLGVSVTDEEKMRRLEGDTCPGFISDGWNRVWWTNRAFRDMARKTTSFSRQVEDGKDDMAVWVVMRETVPLTCQAYACRVRVQFTWKSTAEDGFVASSSSVTSPCDVWRMRSGGFAWRLDVNAALRLGR